MPPKKELQKAHAAAAKRASRARLEALKNKGRAAGAPVTPSRSEVWSVLMQKCADAQASASREPECLEGWRSAVACAGALRAAVGEDEATTRKAKAKASCEDEGCESCGASEGPQKWSFLPAGVTMPPVAAVDEPTAEETANARAFASSHELKALYGLGLAQFKGGHRGAAAQTFGEVLLHAGDEERRWRCAWEARAAAFGAMTGGDGDEGVHALVELLLTGSEKGDGFSPFSRGSCDLSSLQVSTQSFHSEFWPRDHLSSRVLLKSRPVPCDTCSSLNSQR